jgi:YadA-like membrane anchor domain
VTASGTVQGATLTSTGATNVGGTLTVNGVANLNGGVAITGTTTVDDLTVNNNATVGGMLDVTGVANLNGGAEVTGFVNVHSTLSIDGPAIITGQSNLNGGANVSNHLTVAAASTVDMGGNRVQNVGAPVAATDAATKGYVDSYIGTSSREFDALNSEVNHAFQKIDENTEGIAVAMAMGGLTLPDSKAFALSANMGFYDDKQALAAQAAIRLNRTFALTGGVGLGFDQGKVGGRVGVMAAW